jgi:hypothetical protein
MRFPNFPIFFGGFSLGFDLDALDICVGTIAILVNKMRRALRDG